MRREAVGAVEMCGEETREQEMWEVGDMEMKLI